MIKFFKQSTQKTFIILTAIIVFMAIFALNYFFPIYADDMMYSVFKHNEPFSFGVAVDETLAFLKLYYFTWGGRVVAHITAFVLLMFNNIPQSIIKTGIYLALVYYSYLFVKDKKQSSFFVFFLLAISYFYFTPSFLSSAIWTTGSANYLCMIALTVFYLYCLKKYTLRLKRYRTNILEVFLISVLSLIVGCTNENLSPVLILMMLSYMYWLRRNEKRVPPTFILFTILVIVGCALMVFAPGNSVRAESEGYPSLFNSFGAMGSRLSGIQASYRYFMFRPIIIYVVCAILFYFFPQSKANKSKVYFASLIFFIGANISIWITLFSPTFPPRAFMSITVLTFISIAILYAQIDFKKTLPLVINCIFLFLLVVFGGKDYLTFLKGSYFLDKVMKQRTELIDAAIQEGKKDVNIEKVYLDYRFEYSDFVNYYQDYYKVRVNFLEKGDPRLSQSEQNNNE